jgi:6-phosphofructokinase 2
LAEIPSTQIVTLTINPAVDVSTSVKKMVPFTKMRCAQTHRDPGRGGINVARVLKRLGNATAIYPGGGATGKLLKTLVAREGVGNIVIPASNDTRENITIFDERTREQYRLVFPGAPLSEIEWQGCLGSIARIGPSDRRPTRNNSFRSPCSAAARPAKYLPKASIRSVDALVLASLSGK